jgi:uncharacterized membrane protein YfcA
MTDSVFFYSVLIPATAIAGFIRGFAGFGGPLFLLPVLNFFVSPAVSAGTVIWIDLFANLRLLPDVKGDAGRDIVIPLTAGTVIAMPAGVYLLVNADQHLMKQVVGAVILVIALILATGWRYQGSTGKPVYGVVGTLGGFVMGATSIAVTTALFLNSGHQSARESRANFIVWVFFATILFLSLLALGGTLSGSDAFTIGVLSPVYLVGAVLGSRAQHGASDLVARRVVLALIVVVAIASLVN